LDQSGRGRAGRLLRGSRDYYKNRALLLSGLGNINHKHTNWESLLVDIAQLLVLGVDQVIDGIVVHNTICRNRRRERHEGRSSVRVGRVGRKIFDPGNGTSIKRPEIGGIGVLPVIPKFVDHRVVHEEQRIIGGPLRARYATGGGIRWTIAEKIPSNHTMNCAMRRDFKSCLKTNEIPYKTIYHGLLTLGRSYVPQGLVGPTSKGCVIMTTKPMRGGIREGEAICESTVGDLIVIIGVPPTPDAGGGVSVPERTVPEI